jgi:Icc-related predicted phosphoesterase
MRIQLISDIHLEFQKDYPRIKNNNADLLVLSGDICLVEHLHRNPTAGIDYYIQNGWYANDAIRYRNFFNHVSKEFPLVLYVIGNHEHYSGRWNDTAERLHTALEPFDNIVLMDNLYLNINGVRFIGTSLWTDFNNNDPLTMVSIKDMMNDYRAITINNNDVYHKLRPIDTLVAHNTAVKFIKDSLKSWNGPAVVLTHHAPSHLSIHEKYKKDRIMNGAFVSSLDELILDNTQIKLWTHGHVHNAFDYFIGETRIVCNPYGYPGEVSKCDLTKVIEI